MALGRSSLLVALTEDLQDCGLLLPVLHRVVQTADVCVCDQLSWVLTSGMCVQRLRGIYAWGVCVCCFLLASRVVVLEPPQLVLRLVLYHTATCHCRRVWGSAGAFTVTAAVGWLYHHVT